MQIVVLSLLVGAGLFSIYCALKNYDWFFSHRRAQTMILFLGRTGARIVYITLGVALVVMGTFFIVKGGYADVEGMPDAAAEGLP